MYGSGIRALDDLAGELDKNSQSTYGKLNSQVLMHSTTLDAVCIVGCFFEMTPISSSTIFFFCYNVFPVAQSFKAIAGEADQLLNELQGSLNKQEDKLAAFAQQQRKVSAQ